MSRYEQVCDMLRQRRVLREAAKADLVVGIWRDGHRLFSEQEILAVLQDALIELGPLFRNDAKECSALMQETKGKQEERRRCLLVHQYEDAWPLQSELDA
jgi:hypothetical protein